MPKEVIRNPSGGPFETRIGWGREAVQIGVEGVDGRSLLWLLYGTELAQLGEVVRRIVEDARGDVQGHVAPAPSADVGRDVLNALDVLASGATISEGDPIPHACLGVWSDIDRAGCNDLIRHLRRARDASFGRDE